VCAACVIRLQLARHSGVGGGARGCTARAPGGVTCRVKSSITSEYAKPEEGRGEAGRAGPGLMLTCIQPGRWAPPRRCPGRSREPACGIWGVAKSRGTDRQCAG
jgi:hypothetical protein